MNRIFFICIFSFPLLSCVNNLNEELIASVYHDNLYFGDIMKNMPNHVIDTSYFVKKYTESWVKDKILLHHAKINLDIDMQEYDKTIEEYRNSLLIHTYEQQLIDQNLDTTISNDIIYDYYSNNMDKFTLNQSICKGRYIIVNKLAPKLNLLEEWYKSDNKEVFLKLEDYCKQFATDYFLIDTTWQYFSLITNKLPEKNNNNTDDLLQYNNSFVLEDDINKYYIYIKDFRIRGDISPFLLEKDKIKSVLLNKKKIRYLEELVYDLYNNSLALDKVKIYY